MGCQETTMGPNAKVTSVDAVGQFAAALRCFRHDVGTILEVQQQRIHRMVDWVRQEQRQYWRRQLRLSERQVHEAKLNLERCLFFRQVGDRPPACVEEKRALQRAKRRLQLCREKVEAVRRWSVAIERAVFEYRGGVGPLSRWVEGSAERSLALLGRICRILEEYASTGSEAANGALAGLPWTDEQPDESHPKPADDSGSQSEDGSEKEVS
jgi:hypothetical protein